MALRQNRLAAKVNAFLYHEVTDGSGQTGFEIDPASPYRLRTREFNENLNQIASSPVKPTLIEEVDFTQSNKFLLLTFDDGGRSALYIADQIEKRAWKGHFFITTAFIGNKYFLSKQDIIELYSRGHIIGSHSHSHPFIFDTLSFNQLYEEWRISLDVLSSILHNSIIYASIPCGRMDINTKLSAQKAGIKFLFTSEPTFTPWRIDEMICLGRVCPIQGTPLRVIRDLAQFKKYKYKFFIQKTKRLVKRIIGPYFMEGKDKCLTRGKTG